MIYSKKKKKKRINIDNSKWLRALCVTNIKFNRRNLSFMIKMKKKKQYIKSLTYSTNRYWSIGFCM